MRAFIPCRKCAAKPGPVPGYYYVERNGLQAVRECECHIKWQKDKAFEAASTRGNIWSTPLSIDDYVGTASTADVQAVKTYVEQFSKKYASSMLYVYGPHGTQKTTTMMWAAQQLLRESVSVAYTLMETLTTLLVPDFNDTSPTRAQTIDFFMKVDLLIVDEAFDRRTTTLYKSGYQLPFLTNFLKTRFEVERNGIAFISNVKPTNIADQGFGPGLHDLVNRNVSRSTLTFTDTYIANTPAITNPRGLFE